MNQWNRYGRDEEQRRHGSDDWSRRDQGRQFGQNREHRSFNQWDYGDQRRSDQPRDDRRPSEYEPMDGRQGYGGRGDEQWSGRSFGGHDNIYRGMRDQRSSGYGGRGFRRENYESRGYGSQSNRGSQGYDEQDRWQSGQGERGWMGDNEPLQRVTDGDEDHGFFQRFGERSREERSFGGQDRMGEHRGRGPRNYTRSDERVREDVNDRLSDDSWLDASEIEVQVSNCEVTLAGRVQNRQDKRRAEDLAEQVSGVKHVQNNLRVQQMDVQGQATTAGAARSSQGAGMKTGSATPTTQ